MLVDLVAVLEVGVPILWRRRKLLASLPYWGYLFLLFGTGVLVDGVSSLLRAQSRGVFLEVE